MSKTLVKVIRSPRTVWNVFNDRLFAPLWVRWNGVEYGENCRFYGIPLIWLAPGGCIRLGNRVRVNSRTNTNPRGLPFPTILAAQAPGGSIQIGDDTGLSGVSIVAREFISIGKRVQIGPGAGIWDNDGHGLEAETRRNNIEAIRRAPIRIEDDVFIGARALILKGVTIGKGAVVGAGAVVTKDVAPGEIVGGNPARVIGTVHKATETQVAS